MIKRPALYGLNRNKRRQLDHLSVGQKRQAMSDLRHDLALLTIRRSDPILDANLIRWDDYIDGGRVDGIANALREMMAFVDQCHAEYKAADLEDSQCSK